MRPRIHEVNDSFFKKIDTEEKAYILGFLFADGCVSERRSRIKLTLLKKDKEILEKIAEILSNYPIKDYTYKRGTETSELSFYSKEMYDDLVNLGCTPKKSLTLIFPTEEQVPKYLIHHFIRGYFDGDGSVSHCKRRVNESVMEVSIIGTYSFLKSLSENLNISENLNVYKHKSVWVFKICSKKARSFFKIVYEDATIYMDRKYQKFLEKGDVQRL